MNKENKILEISSFEFRMERAYARGYNDVKFAFRRAPDETANVYGFRKAYYVNHEQHCGDLVVRYSLDGTADNNMETRINYYYYHQFVYE